MFSIKVTADGTFEVWSDTLNCGFYSDSKTDNRDAVTTCYLGSNVVSVAHEYLHLKVGKLKISYN